MNYCSMCGPSFGWPVPAPSGEKVKGVCDFCKEEKVCNHMPQWEVDAYVEDKRNRASAKR